MGLDLLYVGTLPPHPGGSAIVGAQLLSGLAKRGHSVRALAPVTARALRSCDHLAASRPGLGVATFDVPSFIVSSALAVPSFIVSSALAVSDDYLRDQRDQITERLADLIAERRPDAIIIGREGFVWHVPDLARSHALPSIVLIHGSTAFGVMSSLDDAVARRLLDQLRKVDLAVLVARHLVGHAEQLGLRHVRIIPNGVDLQRFSAGPKDPALPRRLDIRDDRIVVAHASKLEQVKRPLDIVDSAERVLGRKPEVVYLIVGDGPCRAAMKERCRQKGILDNFRFVGWVEHERVPEYLNLADIVVMPSESEGQALACLEAQACGRLLLASDIPAAREIVRDGETGLLFQTGDIDHFAAQTLRAAGDAELRAAIGRRARDWVSAHHDLERTVASYEGALREVAGRPAR